MTPNRIAEIESVVASLNREGYKLPYVEELLTEVRRLRKAAGETTTDNRPGNGKDHYLDLILQFPLRPIRSDEELDEAIRMVDSLLDRRDLVQGEKDYLDVLGDLIERYESEAHPIA